MLTLAFASTVAAPAASSYSPEGAASFLPLIIVFAVFWFLVIRPQSKRMKDQKVMIENLKRGDEIVTSGGIIGKIDRVVDDGELMVKIAEGVSVRVARQSVAVLLSKPDPVNENTPTHSADKKGLKTKKKTDSKTEKTTRDGNVEEKSPTLKVVD